MSVAPGWYEDPGDPTRIRYWDGTEWTDHTQDAPAEETIDGIELAEAFAAGSTAEVHRGRQPALDRDVAVKIITTDLDDAAKRRFEREQVAMGRLSAHPGIVPIYQSGLTSLGRPFIVMPYLPGSLADEISIDGVIDPLVAADTMAKICDAVHFAHQHGILHRDIKPGNILRSPVGDPMITDFGIAQLGVDDEFAKADSSLTPLYAAPEVLLLQGATVASDVYALGATLFTMVHGSPAFADGERTLAAIHRRVTTEPVPQPAAALPPAIWDAIRDAMAKDPAERPSGADDLARRLRATPRSPAVLAAPLSSAAPATVQVDTSGPRPAPTPPSRRRPWGLVAVATLLVAALVAGGVFLLSRNGDDDADGADGQVAADDQSGRDDGSEDTPTDGGTVDAGGGDAGAGPDDDPEPTTAPEPVAPPLDLVAAQARHGADAFVVTWAGCGLIGTASATPVSEQVLIASGDVADAGWLTEVRDVAGGPVQRGAVVGATEDGLAVVRLDEPIDVELVPGQASVGDRVAVIGAISPDTLFPALEAEVVEARDGELVAIASGTVTDSVEGAPVFDSLERHVGSVIGVDGDRLVIRSSPAGTAVPRDPLCSRVEGTPAAGAPFENEVPNAYVLAQQLATALADGDWDLVRELEPGKASFTDQRFEDGWGLLDRSTLVPATPTVADGAVRWRLLLVAHETDGGQITRLFCVDWVMDVAAGVADQTGENTVRLADQPGWLDPAALRPAALNSC